MALIKKGWNEASDQSKWSQQNEWSSKHGEKQRGNDGFRGRPSEHLMMVRIQASVSVTIFEFLQNLCLFWLCCHQSPKRGDCKEHGPIRTLFCDFGNWVTPQLMGLMSLSSEHL